MVNGTGRGRRNVALVIIAATTLVLAACGGIVSDQAQKDLETKYSTSTLAIYPVGVLRGTDFSSAPADVAAIVDGLRAMGFAAVEAASDRPEVRTVWRRDQNDMLKQVAGEITQYVRTHPPKGHFALYAQYLQPAESDKIIGIQWVIADRQGRIAASGLLNSHDPRFVERQPSSRAQATALLVDSVKHNLGGMMAKR